MTSHRRRRHSELPRDRRRTRARPIPAPDQPRKPLRIPHRSSSPKTNDTCGTEGARLREDSWRVKSASSLANSPVYLVDETPKHGMGSLSRTRTRLRRWWSISPGHGRRQRALIRPPCTVLTRLHEAGGIRQWARFACTRLSTDGCTPTIDGRNHPLDVKSVRRAATEMPR